MKYGYVSSKATKYLCRIKKSERADSQNSPVDLSTGVHFSGVVVGRLSGHDVRHVAPGIESESLLADGDVNS